MVLAFSWSSMHAITKFAASDSDQGKLRSIPNRSSAWVTFARALFVTFMVLNALEAPRSSCALPMN